MANKNPNRSGLRPPIQKGEVRNPTGRPKTSKESILMQLAELVTISTPSGARIMSVREAIIKAQVNKSLRGDSRACEFLIYQTEGKPVQTQILVSDNESKYNSLSVRELLELREIAKREAEAVGVVYVPVIELKE